MSKKPPRIVPMGKVPDPGGNTAARTRLKAGNRVPPKPPRDESWMVTYNVGGLPGREKK